MPKTINGGKINFEVSMSAQKNNLDSLLKPLQELQTKIQSMSTNNLTQGFQEAASAAKNLESIISSSWNDKLGQLNLNTFNQSVQTSYGSLENLKNVLYGAGTSGQAAFSNLATSILNTNIQIKESNKLLDDMATSMANTVKWGITSSIFNTITGSIQQAYYYSKDLDRSLNNIRIVTGDSADAMQRFAKLANNTAQNLGRSTLDYTDAALSFYQQGLQFEQVQARTQATLKAQNITGVGTQMVDYLTAVWNGFEASNEQIELFVDKLAKVADRSASDMSQLAIAMSKVASTANVMGVDIDQLTAQIATVVAVTRQAPESVGTAFKTIYSRLNDIKAGADDAQISLGNYSGKMAELGFNVLDANGKLRNTGQVIEQIGSRWQTLSKEQQISLAQVMGGMRQVNQITALFENWTMYSNLLNDSLSAQGTLNEKNNIYLESTAAHIEQLNAEAEHTYDILFDQNIVKGFTDIFKTALGTFNDYISGIGGGANVFIHFGSVVAGVFNKQIASSIVGVENNINRLKENLGSLEAKQKAIESIKGSIAAGYVGQGINLGEEALNKQAEAAEKTLAVQKGLTVQQQKQAVQIQKQIGLTQQKINDLEKQQQIANDTVKTLQQEDIIKGKSIALLESERKQLQYSYEVNQKSLVTMESMGNSFDKISSQTLSYQEHLSTQLNLLDQINLESDNLRDVWIAAGLAEQDFDKNLQIIQQGIKDSNTNTQEFKNAWDAIKATTQQYAKNQQSDLNKIDTYLKNIGIDTSKLTEEEKSRLSLYMQQNDALAQQGKRVVTLQDRIRAMSSITQGMTALFGGVSVAMDETATAAEKANGYFSAFSGTAGAIANYFAPGSGILVTGVFELVKQVLELTSIWQDFEDSLKSTQEKLEDVNNKVKQINTSERDTKNQVSSLEEMSAQYERLSRRAGQYGKNLDNLTAEQQDRYHEITNEFSKYNDAVIVGYDEQGNAIVENQDALRETIELLKQEQREAAKTTLGDVGKTLSDADSAFDEAQKDLEEKITERQRTLATWSQSQGVQTSLASWTMSLAQYFKDQNKQLDDNLKLTVDGAEMSWGQAKAQFQKMFDQGFISPDDLKRVKGIYESLYDVLSETDGFKGSDAKNGMNAILEQIDRMLSTTSQTVDQLDGAVAIAQDKVDKMNDGLTGFNTSIIMAALKFGEGYSENFQRLEDSEFYNDGVYKLLLEYINSFTLDPGALKADLQKRTAGTHEQVVQAGQEYADKLYLALDTYGSQIQAAVKNADTIKAEDIPYQQFLDKIQNAINDAIKSGKFKNIDPQNEEIVENLFKQIFNLDELDIDFNNSQINDLKTSVDTALDTISHTIQTQVSKATQHFGEGSAADISLQLNDYLKLNFDDTQITMIADEIQRTKPIFQSLEDAKKWIEDFLQSSDVDQGLTIEKFDKVANAIDKLVNGKDLKYSEKQTLIDQLGLDDNAMQQLETKAQWLEAIKEKIFKVEDPAQQSQMFAHIYDNVKTYMDEVGELYKEGEITAQSYTAGMRAVYEQQRDQLGLTEEKLQEYADTYGIFADSDEGKAFALVNYQNAQSFDALNEAIIKNKDAILKYRDEGIGNLRDIQGSVDEIAKAWKELTGEDASTDYLVNNLELLSETASELVPILGDTKDAMSGVFIDSDIDTDQFEALSEYLQDAAGSMQGVSDELTTNKNAADDLAEAILRYDHALEQVQTNQKTWLAQLSSGNMQDAAMAANQLRNVYSDLLNLPFENLSSGFASSIDNFYLLQEAINGSTDAYNQLQQAAMNDILFQVGIDPNALIGTYQDFYALKAEIDKGIDAIEIGAFVNPEQFANVYEAMNQLINAADMTQQQATDLLASMGVDAEVVQEPVSETQKQAFIDAQPTIATTYTMVPDIIQDYYGNPTVLGYTMVPVPHIEYKGVPKEEVAEGEKMTTALRVRSARKSSGGEIKYNSSSHGGGSSGQQYRQKQQTTPKKTTPRQTTPKKTTPKKVTPKKQPEKKPDTRTKDKKEKPKNTKPIKHQEQKEEKVKDPDYIEALQEEIDRYHDINFALEQIENELTRLGNKQKKLFGKDLINNLNEQLEILQKQIEAYRVKIKIAEQQRDEIQRSLRLEGVRFDKSSGAIINYSEILEQKLGYVNSVIDYYNGLTAEEQQTYKAVVEQAKEDYEQFKNWLERYDELVAEEIPGLREAIQEARDKEVEIQISKFKMRVQVELDLSQATKDWNQFKRKVIDQLRDDDILGNAKADIQDLFAYYNEDGTAGLIGTLTQQVRETMQQIQKINQTGTSDIYGDNKAQAIQDLKQVSDELMDSLMNVEDLIQQIKEYYFDMVDAAQDAFDEQVKEYQFISDLIDHDKKLLELLYGDDAQKKINVYYQRQKENDKRELEFQRQQKTFWWEEMQRQKARMQTLDKESNQYKEAEDRFKELEDHWMDSVNSFNQAVEDSINTLLDNYKNNVSIIFDDLGNKLTNGKGLDYVKEEWELISAQTSKYLDQIQSMVAIEQLQQAYQAAIQDNQNNLALQQSLNQSMEQQIKMLKDKNKLTQYDVDRANMLLQIQLKRMALQQTQQNKTKLRLRRDSQGNYSYQYVADEQQQDAAQKSLTDAQKELYELDKSQYKSNLNDIYSLQTQFNDKMQQLYNEYPIWTQEAQAKRKLLVEYYGEAINNVVGQNQQIRLNLMDSAFDMLADLYDTDVQNFKQMSSEEQNELMGNLIPEWKSGIQEMADTISGEGGLIPTCIDAFTQLTENTQDYKAQLDELQTIAEINFDELGQGIDESIDKTQGLIEDNQQLIETYNLEMVTVNELIDTVNNLADAYHVAKEQAVAAAEAAHKLWVQEQRQQRQAAEDRTTTDEVYNKGQGIADVNPPSDKDGSSDKNKNKNKGGSPSDNIKTHSSDQDIENTKPRKRFSEEKPQNTKPINRKITAAQIQGIAASIWMDGGKKSGWEHNPTRRQKFIEKFDEQTADKIQEYINKHARNGDIYKNWVHKRDQLKNYYYSAFDTGGYTGAWGRSGKLGILHEKELVLNSSDTQNILSAVSVVRSMNNLLSSLSSNIGNTTNALSSMMRNDSNILGQNVNITANFPNVSNRNEIEAAFNNLINRASQYVY